MSRLLHPLSFVALLCLLSPSKAGQGGVVSRELSVAGADQGPLGPVSREVSIGVPSGPPVVVSRELSVRPGPMELGAVTRELTVRVPPADLVVDVPTVAPLAVGGTYVTVTWGVTNAGGIAAVAPWTDTVALSVDAVAGNADDIVLATYTRAGNLDPGQAYTRVDEIWFPVNVSGTFFLYAFTDSGGVIPEIGEANNLAFAGNPIAVTLFDGVTLKDLWIAPFNFDYDGKSVIVEGTVTVDGSHNFASLTLRNGGTLTHTAELEGGLALTIDDYVRIDTGCAIDLDGKGYAFAEGPGSSPASNRGGGGHGGYGAPSPGWQAAPGYGSLFAPRTLGSGGRGGAAVSPGGGALLLQVGGELRIDGRVSCDGLPKTPYNITGGGAGGSLYIRATDLTGTGSLSADGGLGGTLFFNEGGGGGGGRIHLQTSTNTLVGGITAYGGVGVGRGGAGPIVFENLTTGARDLIVRNQYPGLLIEGQEGLFAPTELPSVLDFRNVLLDDGVRLDAGNANYGLRLFVSGDLTIGPGAALWVSGSGFLGEGPGAGSGQCGGGHYGRGASDDYNCPALTYGDPVYPFLPGSGGDQTAGGGSIIVSVMGDLVLDGPTYANGQPAGYSGGGAGGSVLMLARSIFGSGAIHADGGDGLAGQLCVVSSGGGGGGIVALHYEQSFDFTGTVTTTGGAGHGCSQPAGGGISSFFGGLPVPPSLDPTLNHLIDGLEDFEALPLGPVQVPNNEDTWGSIGAWGFPATYWSFGASGLAHFELVLSATFNPMTGTGQAFHNQAQGPDAYGCGLWVDKITEQPNRILRVGGRFWVPAGSPSGGLFSVGNGNQQAGSSIEEDFGPTLEWLPNGDLVAHTAGMTSTIPLIPATPTDAWQDVRLDVDLSKNTFDFWYATGGQPLERLVEDLPFVTDQLSVDRFIVGGTQALQDAYLDDLSYDYGFARPVAGLRGQGKAGTKGIPRIAANLTSDIRIYVENPYGVETSGFLVFDGGSVGSSGAGLFSGLNGGPSGQIAVEGNVMPISIPPNGFRLVLPDTKVLPAGSPPLFVRAHVQEPGSAFRLATTRELVIHVQP